MSRYTITVTGRGRSDPEAIIGYDPPLQTYFLQAFPHEETDEPALWLGTYERDFDTIVALHAAAFAKGYDFAPIAEEVAAQLAADKAKHAGRPRHGGCLGEPLRKPHFE